MFRIKCSCGQVIKSEKDLGGMTIRCKKCERVIHIEKNDEGQYRAVARNDLTALTEHAIKACNEMLSGKIDLLDKVCLECGHINSLEAKACENCGINPWGDEAAGGVDMDVTEDEAHSSEKPENETDEDEEPEEAEEDSKEEIEDNEEFGEFQIVDLAEAEEEQEEETRERKKKKETTRKFPNIKRDKTQRKTGISSKRFPRLSKTDRKKGGISRRFKKQDDEEKPTPKSSILEKLDKKKKKRDSGRQSTRFFKGRKKKK